MRQSRVVTINLSFLTPAKRALLDEARRLDRLAREAHRMAEHWKAESTLAAGQQKVAAAYERCRDAQVALLCTALGKDAPRSFDQLRVEGELTPKTTPSGTP